MRLLLHISWAAVAFTICGCGPSTPSPSGETPTTAPGKAAADEQKTLKERLCEGNERNPSLPDRQIIPAAHPGYDPGSYFEHHFRSDPIDLATLHYNLESWRQKVLLERMNGDMKRRLMEDIDSHPERWTAESGLRGWLESSDPLSTWPESHAKVINQRGTINCVGGLYVYQALIIMPRRPLDSMPKLNDVIGGGVDRVLQRSLEGLGKTGTVTINIPGQLVEQLQSLISSAQMAKLREEYRNELRMVDEPTRVLVDWLAGDRVDVAPFDSAKFVLSSDMQVVLKVLAQAFLRVAEPKMRYDIVAVGRADSRTLRMREYVGSADLSLAPGRRVPYVAGQGQNRLTLEDNQQLSVARGFTAAQFLSEELQSRGRTDIRILYGGDGIVAGRAVDTARRLEVTLRKSEPGQ